LIKLGPVPYFHIKGKGKGKIIIKKKPSRCHQKGCAELE
jgi:hypothetical protein